MNEAQQKAQELISEWGNKQDAIKCANRIKSETPDVMEVAKDFWNEVVVEISNSES